MVDQAWTVAAEQATAAFADAARDAGAEIRCGERVHRLETGGVVTGGGLVAAGAVVLATGPWLAELEHDVVDPGQPWARPGFVYPRLFALLEGTTPAER